MNLHPNHALLRLPLLFGLLVLLFTGCPPGDEDDITTPTETWDYTRPGSQYNQSLWFESFPVFPMPADTFELTSYSPSVEFWLDIISDRSDEIYFSIFEDSLLMPGEAITTFYGNALNENPFGVTDVFTYDVRMNLSVSPPTQKRYKLFVEGSSGQNRSKEFVINFNVPNGEPTTFDTSGVRLYNAFSVDRGGLDLDTGREVPFDSPEAEIQDESINLNASGESWRRQISAVNGAEIRRVNFNGLGPLVNFSNISQQSDLARLFESGAPLGGSDDFPPVSGDTSNDETVSPAISNRYYPNDGFVVRRADKYYLLRIEGVHLAGDGDNDFYSVSVKH